MASVRFNSSKKTTNYNTEVFNQSMRGTAKMSDRIASFENHNPNLNGQNSQSYMTGSLNLFPNKNSRVSSTYSTEHMLLKMTMDNESKAKQNPKSREYYVKKSKMKPQESNIAEDQQEYEPTELSEVNNINPQGINDQSGHNNIQNTNKSSQRFPITKTNPIRAHLLLDPQFDSPRHNTHQNMTPTAQTQRYEPKVFRNPSVGRIQNNTVKNKPVTKPNPLYYTNNFSNRQPSHQTSQQFLRANTYNPPKQQVEQRKIISQQTFDTLLDYAFNDYSGEEEELTLDGLANAFNYLCEVLKANPINVESLEVIFTMADLDQSQTITFDEFEKVCYKYFKKHVELDN